MPTQEEKDAVMKQMDEAGVLAARELETLPKEAVDRVAQWWRDWYLKAGHKRLGRILAKK